MIKKDPSAPLPTRCRVCGKELPAQREARGPFCSERCRLNDLSKWFGEGYRIASSPAQQELTDTDPDEN